MELLFLPKVSPYDCDYPTWIWQYLFPFFIAFCTVQGQGAHYLIELPGWYCQLDQFGLCPRVTDLHQRELRATTVTAPEWIKNSGKNI